jgi:hypothetical protein
MARIILNIVLICYVYISKTATSFRVSHFVNHQQHQHDTFFMQTGKHTSSFTKQLLSVRPFYRPTVLMEGKESIDQTILDGVVELGDSTSTSQTPTAPVSKVGMNDENSIASSTTAPFLSQGNVMDQEALNPDLSDPKQVRVIIYIILSLLPVLFLIPLMIGSRDLIPLDMVDPVQL